MMFKITAFLFFSGIIFMQCITTTSAGLICSTACDEPEENLMNFVLDSFSGILVNATANYRCPPGYITTPASSHDTIELRCSEDGEWTQPDHSCWPFTDCGDPPSYDNMLVSFSTTYNGSQANYTCQSGYDFQPQQPASEVLVACQDNGEWEPFNATCKLEFLANLSPDVTFLDLSHLNLNELENGTFKDFIFLEGINFEHNNLEASSIDYNAFENTKITTLNFNNNPLKEVPVVNAPNLERLRLENAQITSLSREDFANYPKLTHLWLEGNEVADDDIASDAFVDTKLRILIFKQNRFTRVPHLDAPYLTDLNLNQGNISSISPDVFNKTPKLNDLFLGYNQKLEMCDVVEALSPVKHNMYRVLMQFAKNQRSCTWEIDEFPKLKILSVRASRPFEEQMQLKVQSSSGSNALRYLNIRANQLPTEYFQNFSNFQKMERLYMGQANQIDVLPQLGMSILHTLYVAMSGMVDMVPDAFQGMTNLQIVDLSNNSVDCCDIFPQLLYAKDSLITLHIENAKSTRACEIDLDEFPLLDKVNVGDTKQERPPIMAIFKSSAGSSNLKHLDLTATEINETYLEKNIATFSSLETLILLGNGLANFPILQNAGSLKTLNLDDNQMSTISAAILQSMPGLVTLSLKNNGLDTISGWPTMPNLETLNLKDNLLLAIPEDLFTTMPSLKRLVISGNSVICDCDYVALSTEFVKQGADLVADPDPCAGNLPDCTVSSIEIAATCDGTMTLYIDGVQQSTPNGVEQPHIADTIAMNQEPHVVAIECENSNYDPGILASFGLLEKTDATWLCSAEPCPADWYTMEFDVCAWAGTTTREIETNEGTESNTRPKVAGILSDAVWIWPPGLSGVYSHIGCCRKTYQCPAGTFKCDCGSCIPDAQVCDGTAQCADSTDEQQGCA